MKDLISVVIPLHNEEESLEKLHGLLRSVFERNGLSYEVIFVDDGSTDSSFDILEKIYQQDKNIRILQLRRKFGKSAALTAGFSEVKGNIVVTMDADLQDDPEEILNLLAKINENYDVVGGFRKHRQDGFFKQFTSAIFNKTLNILTGVKLHDINTGLKAYRREALDQIEIYGGLYRFLPIFAHQLGFRIIEIPVKHYPRKHGKSKYGPGKIIDGFLDMLTIVLVTKYSENPGHFFGGAGLLSFLTGFLISLYLTILWFLGHRPIGNRPLFFLGILLLIIGIQLISLGLLGEILVRKERKKVYQIKKILK
jgi:glycosyltransferase involved in cell wall biosynthesis